jgi:sarcosine oxidase subunit beta
VETADVVVVGAGVVGLSAAYELARAGIGRIALLEREELPGMGSTAACTGGIRLQFSGKANIRYSQYSLKRYAHFSDELGVDVELKSDGYLFLLPDEDQIPRYAEGHELQHSLGVNSRFVEPQWIADIAPFLHLEDIVAGSFCPQDAHADPAKVCQAYVRGLRALGITVQTNREVTGIEVDGSRVAGVATTGGPISTEAIVDCAGPFADRVAGMAALKLPLTPRKRHAQVVKPSFEMKDSLPLIIDSGTGWYIKAEPGGIALIGGTDRDGTITLDTLTEENTVDRILEAGILRSPELEDAGLIRTIVGLRCMSPDDNALIGAHPGLEGFYCAAGFSGHGFMHAPAAGVALAEVVTRGRSEFLDSPRFDPARFADGVKVSGESYVF